MRQRADFTVLVPKVRPLPIDIDPGAQLAHYSLSEYRYFIENFQRRLEHDVIVNRDSRYGGALSSADHGAIVGRIQNSNERHSEAIEGIFQSCFFSPYPYRRAAWHGCRSHHNKHP